MSRTLPGCVAQPTDPAGKHQLDGSDGKTPHPTNPSVPDPKTPAETGDGR